MSKVCLLHQGERPKLMLLTFNKRGYVRFGQGTSAILGPEGDGLEKEEGEGES